MEVYKYKKPCGESVSYFIGFFFVSWRAETTLKLSNSLGESFKRFQKNVDYDPVYTQLETNKREYCDDGKCTSCKNQEKRVFYSFGNAQLAPKPFELLEIK